MRQQLPDRQRGDPFGRSGRCPPGDRVVEAEQPVLDRPPDAQRRQRLDRAAQFADIPGGRRHPGLDLAEGTVGDDLAIVPDVQVHTQRGAGGHGVPAHGGRATQVHPGRGRHARTLPTGATTAWYRSSNQST